MPSRRQLIGSGLTLFLIALPLACKQGEVSAPKKVTAPATLHATVSLDAAHLHQEWEGFGVSTAYYQNWITAHPNKAALYDALFKGLKLDILRLQNVYRPEKGADFAKDEVDILQGAEASLGHPIPIMMSSWSPPAALKSTKGEKHGGTLAQENGQFVYDKFAGYWYDALVAYQKIGIVPTYISIQNEVDFVAEWESCIFKPNETTVDGKKYAGYDKALTAVYNRTQTLPNPPKIVGPETLGLGNGSISDFIEGKNKPVRDKLYAIAHHLYSGKDFQNPDTYTPKFRALRDTYAGVRKFQTEFGDGDGFQTAWMIHNSLVEEEVSAYFYWAAAWPSDDTLITLDNPWKRDEWKNPEGFKLTDRYYALKHYSYYTAPGDHLIETQTDNPIIKVSAFLKSDATRLTVVALNTSETETAELILTTQGFMPRTGAPVGVYRTSEGEQFQELGGLDKGNKVVLPPRAIVTVVMEGGIVPK